MKDKLNDHHLFDGRTLIIATMHGREKIIGPILEKELGLRCGAISGFNTDLFGAFSGEIERKSTALQTVKKKALAALKLCNETLVIASEGSFGSHPSRMFVSANEAFLILIDTKNNLEIVGRHLTVETNFDRREIKSLSDLEKFKTDIGYPEHGVILKIKHSNNYNSIHKNFNTSKI